VLLDEINSHYQEYLLTPDLVELRNIAQVADLIVQCAVTRKESRGLHYMADYPVMDDEHFQKDTILERS
jgi:L-aspartate oxidase